MEPFEGGAPQGEHSGGEHARLREQLHAYAAALTLGQPAAAKFPLLADHLAGCAACRAELAELLQLVEPLYDATLEPAHDLPALDLSFLPAQQPAPRVAPRPPDAPSRLVLILDQHLEALRAGWRSAFAGPALLRARGAPLIDYEPSPASTGGVSVSVQVYPSDTAQDRCDLQLALVLPEGVTAPDGIAVTLQVDAQTWEETADESGLLIFPRAVPPEATQLRITAELLR